MGWEEGEKKKQKLSSRNNIKNGLLKKLPFKNKARQKTLSQTGCQEEGSGIGGTQEHPPKPTEPQQEEEPQSNRNLTRFHTGLCLGRMGMGVGILASGSNITPNPGHVRGL